jgi:hypothetical protein
VFAFDAVVWSVSALRSFALLSDVSLKLSGISVDAMEIGPRFEKKL